MRATSVLASDGHLHTPVLIAMTMLAGFVGPVGSVTGQITDGTAAGNETEVPADATVESLFTDFVHYGLMGRFDAADDYANALLSHPNLDPVAVLEAANRNKKSINTLLMMIRHSPIGDDAARVLELIQEGEHVKRRDSKRIRANLEMLCGNPQQEYFAAKHLAESGEYAVPSIIEALLDPNQAECRSRIVIGLTKLSNSAIRPLTTALNMRDDDVRLHVIRALGEIGYSQAVPYLKALIVDERMPAATRSAASEAIERISLTTGRAFPESPAEQFFLLAEKYFDEDDIVRADPRLSTANYWYWDEGAGTLNRILVPERIFGSAMAMRCCQEALALRPDHTASIALWLAANIRREDRLGMNTESGEQDETGTPPDGTRPEVFPRALYFTQAAGPRYAHLVLQRAIQVGDAAVALGAIRALHVTAGESSLVGTEDVKQPLLLALRFPDLLVRIRAALALGAALPTTPFPDSEFVVPTLASTVMLTGREQVIVVDPDEPNLNRVAQALRTGGREVIAETNFHRAIQRGRAEFQSIGAMFLSSDITEPGVGAALGEIRSEFIHAQTPVVVMMSPRLRAAAEDLCNAADYTECVNAGADDADLEKALERVHSQTGQSDVDGDTARSLALEAVTTLRRIALDARTVYDIGAGEAALIAALASSDEELQTAAAGVLALTRAPTAQRAIASLALDANQSHSLQLAGYGSLAESARKYGNLLSEGQIKALLRIARDDADLTIQTAASQALGALNLSTNQASEIIRTYRGEL